MQAEFWLESWELGSSKTSFHRKDIHPYAKNYASSEWLKGKRVLVPLCGKDNVLMWFREHADHVVGIELAEKAIHQFFDEQNLPYHKTADQRYEAERLTLINRDIFDLQPDEIGPIDFVYDRAALVALPEEMRWRYRQKIDDFMAIGSQCLVITLEYAPFEIPTPLFSITPAEIDEYYRDNYAIDHVEQPEVPNHPMIRKMGLQFLKEHGFLLTKLRSRQADEYNFPSRFVSEPAKFQPQKVLTSLA